MGNPTQLGYTQISGLRYSVDYIDSEQANQLLAAIDQEMWLTDLARRTQHYGYRYDYKSRSVNPSMFLGALPTWAALLAQRLHHDGWIAEVPDQLIVNEYMPGQGIASHIDCEPCFGDTILSLSLGAPCTMIFTHKEQRNSVPLLLEPGSLVIMQGEARYQWKHGILPRKTDSYRGKIYQRGRRVSLTFRNIIL